ncbi:hypothetical protein GQ42DRAFT_18763 [Ramicandelaber brevisporus]|nr:hypothetical protein GQ42DRAFT_18763 [Ramicandelaber brevisporus]
MSTYQYPVSSSAGCYSGYPTRSTYGHSSTYSSHSGYPTPGSSTNASPVESAGSSSSGLNFTNMGGVLTGGSGMSTSADYVPRSVPPVSPLHQSSYPGSTAAGSAYYTAPQSNLFSPYPGYCTSSSSSSSSSNSYAGTHGNYSSYSQPTTTAAVAPQPSYYSPQNYGYNSSSSYNSHHTSNTNYSGNFTSDRYATTPFDTSSAAAASSSVPQRSHRNTNQRCTMTDSLLYRSSFPQIGSSEYNAAQHLNYAQKLSTAARMSRATNAPMSDQLEQLRGQLGQRISKVQQQENELRGLVGNDAAFTNLMNMCVQSDYSPSKSGSYQSNDFMHTLYKHSTTCGRH